MSDIEYTRSSAIAGATSAIYRFLCYWWATQPSNHSFATDKRRQPPTEFFFYLWATSATHLFICYWWATFTCSFAIDERRQPSTYSFAIDERRQPSTYSLAIVERCQPSTYSFAIVEWRQTPTFFSAIWWATFTCSFAIDNRHTHSKKFP